MITVSLFLSITMILIIFFVLIRKKNNVLVLIFISMGIEYLFTSFISVIADNENLWRISKEPSHFVIFRVAEVLVIPLLLLWFLELERRVQSLPAKALLFAVWTILLIGIEQILIHLKIMDQVGWAFGASFVTWMSFLIITNLLRRLFSSLLQKEGISP